ncbi:ABC transporter substrate-binding protein [Luteipulveratus mongoliensis]|uniref:Sugar ABC transporter substrate-binding protein n=1 Tax=Luteipulveratus mongoliensis TaxID=571913 RepID=A0A0K1JIG1_9MICO|nr:sugar ABC transporter substrate-binding protein [Luteipulveratus mongoliensis]AKU16512.1 sugar ABC transporter substrate-binding protein [Luteipulveratus mongoliensis]
MREETPADPSPRVTRSTVGRRQFLRLSTGLAVAGLAGAPILTGCSRGGKNTKELSFWNFYAPDPTGSPQSKWFESMVAEWNRNNDVRIKLRFIPGSQYLGGNVLQTAFSTGEGPDIFLISPGDFLRYYNGGACVDLTPHLEPGVRSDFVKGALETRTVGGKVYAMPMEIEPLALYYDIAAFEKAKLSEADLPRTWDQMLDVAEKLTTKQRFGVQFETVPGYYQNFTWYPFMWQAGGTPVTADASASEFDSEAVRRALALWSDTQRRGLAPKQALGGGAGDVPSNLAAGFSAMQQSGIWAVSDMRNLKPKYRYGVMPLPTPAGGKEQTCGGGWAFAANTYGDNPEAAARFITWALASTSPEGVERGRQWNTVAKTNLPTRASVQASARAHGAFTSGPLKTFADVIVPTVRSEPRYPPEVYKAISDAIQGTQLSGKATGSAAGRASDVIDNFLQTYDGATIL